ncbi:MAG: hypothetical protein H6644_09525 [Caldilineaceae bacterium]|nr:hypothetical protein [Caldilineaceae bacterium]
MRKEQQFVPIAWALLFWVALAAVPVRAVAAPLDSTHPAVHGQQSTPTPQPEAEPDAEVAADAEVTATSPLTITVPLTTRVVVTTTPVATNVTTATAVSTVTATVSVSETQPILAPTATPIPSGEAPATGVAENATGAASIEVEEGVLEGTIVANRSDASVRFFVEGQLFTLDPRRSIGLDLPRVSAVLNLFNCDATTPETQAGCYWDPYLLQREGFYEIVTGAEGGEAVSLMLREAGAPEADEIWIQNRTGRVETVVYRSETFELTPASVQEFTVGADEMPTFFLRSCVEAEDEIVCEWLPVVAETGVYYSLTLIETAGGLPGSTVSMLELKPVLTGNAAEVIETPPQALCTLQVPTLNVRSGPGLEYEIVTKIRGTETEPATVLVTGRNPVGDWLAVDERVAKGGWITSSNSYIACDGDLGSLPEAAVTDGRLAPTPIPVAEADAVAAAPADGAGDGEAPAADSAAADGTAEEGADAQSTPQVTEPPEGLALLIINNVFDYEVRFTLDQRFRVEPAPSEIDLQPGESTSIVIYPDFISFSVSSAWNSMSGNADFYMEPDETRTLWLIFIPDPDGSGQWILQY